MSTTTLETEKQAVQDLLHDAWTNAKYIELTIEAGGDDAITPDENALVKGLALKLLKSRGDLTRDALEDLEYSIHVGIRYVFVEDEDNEEAFVLEYGYVADDRLRVSLVE